MAINALHVVQEHDHPQLLAHTIRANDLSRVAGQAPIEDTNLGVKTRYRQAGASHTVTHAGDGALTLAFPETQRTATPGQSTVLYDDEVCLGDGIVSATEPAVAEKAIA